MVASQQEANYSPELEHGKSIASSFDQFQPCQLSDVTKIRHVVYEADSSEANSSLTNRNDIRDVVRKSPAPGYEFFFVHKYLVENTPGEVIPQDANKLRISRACLDMLVDRLMIPPAFVFALSRHYLPNGRGSRRLHISGSAALDFWYIMPTRVQVEASPTSGRSAPVTGHMNPFHKLQLPDLTAKLEIHRSCVAIFSRFEPANRRFTMVTLDFMHGGWPKVAQEPCLRIGEVMRHQGADAAVSWGTRGHSAHLVYISSAARWWANSLNSVNEQLIAYEMKLQTELDSEAITPDAVLTEVSRGLHSVAAHLHRYLSELKSLEGIALELSAHFESIHGPRAEAEDLDAHEHASRGFSQVLSQVVALHDFTTELEKKTQNILALLFNRMKINSDRLLVANGRAMQKILSSMESDASLGRQVAEASHVLSKEMKKDSIAMKTIAIVTMFFLPGATIATLLSMPFFDKSDFFGEMSNAWLWAVLTIPSTAACFVFYMKWRKRLRDSAAEQEKSAEKAA